jgi:quercetin dioxygenase-like cupin family protein
VTKRVRERVAVILAIALLTVAAIALSPASHAQDQSSYEKALTRTVLGSDDPPTAPGETLQLALISVPPGTSLPVHSHPGVQIASVVQGELTYHVLQGSATINRAEGVGTPMPTEELQAGQSTVLSGGDTVIEREGMIHYGENLGTEPVLIYTSTLFTTGQPGSTVYATPLATPAP